MKVHPVIRFRFREKLLLLYDSTLQELADVIHLGFQHPLALGEGVDAEVALIDRDDDCILLVELGK